jgi:cytochrome c5/outer membrane protein OmpA-like peptidoglycan-associated protein
MSDVHPAHDGHEAHEGPIKTPKQLIWAVLFAFVVPIIGIILLANYVNFGARPAAGTAALEAEAVAARIQPVGSIELKAAGGATVARSGEDVYKAQCAACHATGAAGAPKFQDAAAWGPRLAQGFDGLWKSALNGKNAMPKQSGGDLSDFEIARGVVYMANAGGGKLAEPKAPAGGASAPEGAAADAGAAAAAPAAPAAAEAPVAAAPAAVAAPAASEPVAAAAPAAAAPKEGAYLEASAGLVKLYFASGKADLPGDAKAALGQLANEVKAGGKRVVISGFHDAKGNAASNAKLAKARAIAARDVLLAAGVAKDKLELKKPENAQGDGNSAQARRVEVAVQ